MCWRREWGRLGAWEAVLARACVCVCVCVCVLIDGRRYGRVRGMLFPDNSCWISENSQVFASWLSHPVCFLFHQTPCWISEDTECEVSEGPGQAPWGLKGGEVLLPWEHSTSGREKPSVSLGGDNLPKNRNLQKKFSLDPRDWSWLLEGHSLSSNFSWILAFDSGSVSSKERPLSTSSSSAALPDKLPGMGKQGTGPGSQSSLSGARAGRLLCLLVVRSLGVKRLGLWGPAFLSASHLPLSWILQTPCVPVTLNFSWETSPAWRRDSHLPSCQGVLLPFFSQLSFQFSFTQVWEGEKELDFFTCSSGCLLLSLSSS